jgi:alcohol dehydrogenase
MLGATHACANPLTKHFGTIHAVAIAVMLPHVVRWNAETAGALYFELYSGDLAARLDHLARAAELPRTLREIGVQRTVLTELAADASSEWTGTFNPRPFDSSSALALYQNAF